MWDSKPNGRNPKGFGASVRKNNRGAKNQFFF